MPFTRKFYLADTHLNHELMLDPNGCARPFSSTREMDQFIEDMWNSTVGTHDIVYHLGDVAFKLVEQAERLKALFARLKGRKFLVPGNHDIDKNGNLHPTIASLGWEAPPSAIMETTDEGERLVLCHYALRTWPGIRKGSWHFYGHSHGDLPGVGRSRDVGIDCPDMGYAPRTFQELTAGMRDIPVHVEEDDVAARAMGM